MIGLNTFKDWYYAADEKPFVEYFRRCINSKRISFDDIEKNLDYLNPIYMSMVKIDLSHHSTKNLRKLFKNFKEFHS